VDLEVLENEKTKEEKQTIDQYIKRFLKEAKNKLVVLYGEPFVGKTTFCHVLSKYFPETYYLRIDKNFEKEIFSKLGSNIRYIDINHPRGLISAIDSLIRERPTGILVVVDSITGLDGYFIPQDPTYPSPRLENARAKFIDAVLQKLSYIKGKNTVIIVSHEKIKDFQTNEIIPRFSRTALRHADVVYRMIYDVQTNTRRIVKVYSRELPETIMFEVL